MLPKSNLGIMEKEMETTIVSWGNIGIMEMGLLFCSFLLGLDLISSFLDLGAGGFGISPPWGGAFLRYSPP